MKLLHALSILVALAAPTSAGAADQIRRGGDAVSTQTQINHSDGSRGYGLAQAVFRYDMGEHKVSRIGHMLGLGAAHNWFGDASPEQYHFDVTHWVLPVGSKIHTVRKAGCTGPCELGIGKPPAGHLLVLAGFNLETVDGSEHAISTIAIEPNMSRRRIAVELNDGTNFAYNATVQFAYVPTKLVHGGTVYTATKTSNGNGRPRVKFNLPRVSAGRSFNMYQGFRVNFVDNKARPLARFMLTSGGTAVGVWLNDTSMNDPFKATVHVVRGSF